MSDSVLTPPVVDLARDRGRSLFARTMGYVAATAALFALGASWGQDLPSAWGFVAFLGAFAALVGMGFARRRSSDLSVVLLAAVGLLLGVGSAPTLAAYASTDPQALWLSAAATALFIAGFGVAGYSTRRDLSGLARVSSWALVGLIGFGIVLVFVTIPGGTLVYSVVGLVVFAAYTLVDFQRLSRSTDVDSAPLMAASIFLDILNVFLFFQQVFSRGD
ncbi:Bax inhibitor-1/YccA family protein [Mumia sp. DW29H23]|uniref:Bax inhibitor-1/YccA family protein n=1 Tax=Mumia sp. DW29H23 TaxID=3421241 RepID=UPI003D69674E